MHTYCYVVSDSEGFIGGFLTIKSAEEAVHEYTEQGVPFIVSKFPLNTTIQTNPVDTYPIFVLPYKGNNAVAFVSNDLDEVRKVHSALCRLDLTYEGEPDFWEAPINTIVEAAKRRLDQQTKEPPSNKTSAVNDFISSLCKEHLHCTRAFVEENERSVIRQLPNNL